MTLNTTIHGKAPVPANNRAGDAWTFRAPRHGDLVVCPYCDADTHCDHCGDERRLYASEVLQ